MSDNSDNDNQNDKQLKTNNNEIEVKTKDNEDIDDTIEDNNQSPDLEDGSQDRKSSDLVKPISSPESESERRCTSASNAGESEYESADDEEIKQRDDSFEDTSSDHKNQSLEDTNVETVCDQTVAVSGDNETEIISEIEDKDIETVVNSEPISTSTDLQINGNNCDNTSKDNDLPEEEKEVINEDISEKPIEVLKSDSIEIKETESRVEAMDKNTEGLDQKVDEKYDEIVDNDINEELIDEEGGIEEIADIDEEYEDIDESDVCSDDSEDNDLKYESIDKENEDIEGEERQQGDGEENNEIQSQKDKNLDQDEDKRNPQYIPKRGPFYEHDDRTAESMAAAEQELVAEEVVAEEAEELPPKPVVIAKKPIETEDNKKKTKKKVWVDSERWGHDLFRPEEQTPKSKDELVNVYGYDIRNEDDAPKARRKRYYGRGPNKYTRQWQDENAYARGRTSPVGDKNSMGDRNEIIDRNDRQMRFESERHERMSERKERSGSDRSIDFKERNDRFDRKDRIERKVKGDRRERPKRHERSDRMDDRINRTERVKELGLKKPMVRNDWPLSENRKHDFEEKSEKRVQPFSKEDFPELSNNDLRKKLNSNQTSGQQEVWKSSPRFVGQTSVESEEQTKIDYKTEPMKIIEAIEHNNRNQQSFVDPNTQSVVRTQTFENSKYFRRSSGGYDYEDDRAGTGRIRSRKSAEVMESSGRAIRKTSNNSKEATDNYRNRNNVRSDRSYNSEDSNRFFEGEDNFRNQREVNYVSEANVVLQKMSIEDKTSVLAKSGETEQTRPKRYSSLRQQRVISDNMSNITPNTQITQTNDNRNIPSHQFYESHPIPTSPYFSEPTAPRNTYQMTYITNNANDTQTLPSTYMTQPMPQTITQTIQQPIPQPIPQPLAQQIPQQMAQRFIPQPTNPSAGDSPRYIPTNVSTAPIPSPQLSQNMPQTGPPPPPNVMPAPPPGTAYIPSFPSGYPQFPPAPPPTHVPPGYPGHVAAQPPSPHQLAELYRGGVTYYDTQSQQQNSVRQIPQRRPKAAIPIVPPPDSSDGDGDKAYVSVNS